MRKKKRKKFGDNDETKTRKTLREAAYQYVLDHAYHTDKGVVVNFFLPKKEDFYRKLEAREYRDYVRVKNEEQYLDYQKWYRQYKKLLDSYKWTQMMNKKHRILRQQGGWYVWFLYKVKKWNQKELNKRLEKIKL